MSTIQLLSIVFAFIGSSTFCALFSWLSTRKSKTTKRIECIERHCTRTQLLLLISDYPHNHEEIFKVSQEYFVKLGGNWYMDTIFNTWLKAEQLERPDWFRNREG